MLGFHHHIDQGQGNIVALGEDLPRLGRRMGRQQFEWTVLEFEATQGQAGDAVNLGIIVDQQDTPGGFIRGRSRRLRRLAGRVIGEEVHDGPQALVMT